MKKTFKRALAVLLCLCMAVQLMPMGSLAAPADDAAYNQQAPAVSDAFYQLPDGSWDYSGYLDEAIRYIEEIQLKDSGLWSQFVQQFRDHTDSLTSGWSWRGEFWGKMMRGASMTYQYTGDAELYAVLEASVRDLLTTQDELGRISAHSVETEYRSWDIWSRKYVMLGLEYFYDICPDETLKAQIITALCRHADYMVNTIGPEEDKKMGILQTSDAWGGLNSSSILEPFVKLYNLTGEQRYLDFARYILECGGCSGGNIFQMAKEGKLYPYQYPATKAYEMMSNFEGMIEYYRATGDEQWLPAIRNFYEMLRDSDITIIGCAGCTHELFDHSTVEQTNPDKAAGLMQEHCVTVTWMKLCYQVLRLTGDVTAADEIERSVYNALLGAINSEGVSVNGGYPFDSYSPLINNTRGRGTGGGQYFPAGGGYGCCVSIGSAGTALIPLVSAMRSADGLAMNLYLPGTVEAAAPSGQAVQLSIDTAYPADGDIAVTVNPSQPETFTMRLRIPAWSKATTLLVNGQAVEQVEPGSYAAVTREWKAGDVIELKLDMRARLIEAPEGGANSDGLYFNAIERGPIVLARDARLNDGDLAAGVRIAADMDGYIDLKPSNTANFNRHFEYEVPVTRGEPFHVIDYSSAGKTWNAESLLTAWIPTKNLYELVDLTQPVIAACSATGKMAQINEQGVLQKAELYSESKNPNKYTWTLEDASEGYCRIRVEALGKYLTMDPDGSGNEGTLIKALDKMDSDRQLWKVQHLRQDKYKLASKVNGKLISEAGDSENIHMWGDLNVDAQVWVFHHPDGPNTKDRYVLIGREDGKVAEMGGEWLQRTTLWDQVQDANAVSWRFVMAEDGDYRIQSTVTGKYLTVDPAWSTTDSASIFEMDYLEEDYQLWSLNETDGYYKIASKASGKLMSGAGDSAKIHIWSDAGSPAQQWTLYDIDGEHDETAPAEVSNLRAEVQGDVVSLSWTDPQDEDFGHILITGFGSDRVIRAGSQGVRLSGLEEGAGYRIRIQTVDESGNISEGVTQEIALPASGTYLFNDTSNAIHYDDGSTYTSNFPPYTDGFYNEDTHNFRVAGKRMTFGFNGTSVKWIGSAKKDNGRAEVWLDGELVEIVDCYRETQWIGPLFTAENLTNGVHILEVVTLDSGVYVDFDAFEVTAPEAGVKASVRAVDEEGEPLSEVTAQQLFCVQAVTPDSVQQIALFNEYGLKMGVKELSRTDNQDGTVTWTAKMSIGTVGKGRTISLAVLKDGDYRETDASFTVDVKAPVPTIQSASIETEGVVNTPVTLTAVTDQTVTKLSVVNEYGLKMGLVSSSYVDIDGERVWTAVLKIGTPGQRSFRVSGVNRFGEVSGQVTTNETTITRF
ncbi:MAG: hypothetical protein HFE85_03460 [Clostridiales bacterium]|nr:hypothetical protein [Clostridiales bacterium]